MKVATLYLNEHNNNIKTSVLMAASDTATHFYDLMVEPTLFTQFLDKKAKELGLSEIVVFNAEKKSYR